MKISVFGKSKEFVGKFHQKNDGRNAYYDNLRKTIHELQKNSNEYVTDYVTNAVSQENAETGSDFENDIGQELDEDDEVDTEEGKLWNQDDCRIKKSPSDQIAPLFLSPEVLKLSQTRQVRSKYSCCS